MPIDQMVKQNWNPNLKEKETYQRHQAHRRLRLKLSNRTHRAISDGEIGSKIRERDCVVLLTSSNSNRPRLAPGPEAHWHRRQQDPIRDCLGLVSSPRRAATTPPLKVFQFSTSLTFSLSHLTVLLCSESENGALSLFLFELKNVVLSLELNSFILCLTAFIWHFDFIGLWVCRFVCCECFISLMFRVMLIGSCDSSLLSKGKWGRCGHGVRYLNWGSGQVRAVKA